MTAIPRLMAHTAQHMTPAYQKGHPHKVVRVETRLWARVPQSDNALGEAPAIYLVIAWLPPLPPRCRVRNIS